MEEDSCVKLLKLMEERGAKKNPPSICIGNVASINPLIIQVGDLPLYKDDVLVSTDLLEGYKRQLECNGTTNVYETKDGFNKGDILAMFATADRQTYVVIAKVSRL